MALAGAGNKGRGIVSVGGTLYLWLGHADQKGAAAQFAWSDDHAKTWTFADWRFDEFGLVGFVNFGRDYGGARDDYVYAYSHDGPRADTPADRFVLMRAPQEKNNGTRCVGISGKTRRRQPGLDNRPRAAGRGVHEPR